jgi:hypothetical protein
LCGECGGESIKCNEKVYQFLTSIHLKGKEHATQISRINGTYAASQGRWMGGFRKAALVVVGGAPNSSTSGFITGFRRTGRPFWWRGNLVGWPMGVMSAEAGISDWKLGL